jgi:hypothetical protein
MREFESSHSSPAFPKPEAHPLKEEKSPLLAAFCNSAPVSELSNWRSRGPFREKSPATTANIPVFGRLPVRSPLRARANYFNSLGNLVRSGYMLKIHESSAIDGGIGTTLWRAYQFMRFS